MELRIAVGQLLGDSQLPAPAQRPQVDAVITRAVGVKCGFGMKKLAGRESLALLLKLDYFVCQMTPGWRDPALLKRVPSLWSALVLMGVFSVRCERWGCSFGAVTTNG